MTIRLVFWSVLVALTVAFGTNAPDGSVTVPRADPKLDWARTAMGEMIRLSSTRALRRLSVIECGYSCKASPASCFGSDGRTL